MTILDPGVGRCVVRLDAGMSVTAGGIEIPDDAIEKPFTGTVIAVGPPNITESGDPVAFVVQPPPPGQPREVKPGDRVLFAQHAGMDFKLGVDEYVLMEHADIGGVVREVEVEDAPMWLVPEAAAV